MLNISFFIATFTSIFWFIFSLKFINFATLNNLSLSEIYQYMSFSLFPIAFIWGLFVIIKGYYSEQHSISKLHNTLDLLEKSTKATSEICTALLETELEIKNSFILQKFDTLISDINEILSDIIKQSNSISSNQMEHLWARTAGGERWLIAKTFIETYNFQSGFAAHLLQKAQKDSLLKNSMIEFQMRYQKIKEILEIHDTQKLFYNIIVYGALGSVYNLIHPIIEELTQQETPSFSYTPRQPEKPKFAAIEEPLSFPSFFNDEKGTSPLSASQKPNINKDIKAATQELQAPTLTSQKEIFPAPNISNFDNTQSALKSFKQNPFLETPPNHKKKPPVISLDELEKEINASPENNYDEYAYPFGAWMNDKNHK